MFNDSEKDVVRDKSEIMQWEAGLEERALARWCKEKGKPFDPRKDALVRHRHRYPWHRFNETKAARKAHQLRFRSQMKMRLHRDFDMQPVPHEYKTYGWLTW